MDRDLDVRLDWDGETVKIGRLWSRSTNARDTATFEYERGWLGRRRALALASDLPLRTGQFHAAGRLFNAFTDPAPDRWGRTLLLRRERRQARAEQRAPRTLMDVDFLTLVEDEARLGALRFTDAGEQSFLNLSTSCARMVRSRSVTPPSSGSGWCSTS